MNPEQVQRLLELLSEEYEAAQRAIDRGTEVVDRTRTLGLTVLGAVLVVGIQQSNAPIALLALGLVLVLALIDGYQSANLSEALEHARGLERARRAHADALVHPDKASVDTLIDRLGGLKLGVSLL